MNTFENLGQLCKNIYANLAKFGFLSALLLIILSLLIFNHYWQELGSNPKQKCYLKLHKTMRSLKIIQLYYLHYLVRQVV